MPKGTNAFHNYWLQYLLLTQGLNVNLFTTIIIFSFIIIKG